VGRAADRERTGAIGMALRHTPYVDGTLELYEDREICSITSVPRLCHVL